MFKIASINHRFAAIGQSEVGEQLRAALVEGEEDENSAGIINHKNKNRLDFVHTILYTQSNFNKRHSSRSNYEI